jgi:hypothetical protein
MKVNRRAVRVFAVLTVAAAAGQLVQQDRGAPMAQAALAPVPERTIEVLAAAPAEPLTASATAVDALPKPLVAAAPPPAAQASAQAPVQADAAAPAPAPILIARPAVLPPAIPVVEAAPAPAPMPQQVAAAAAEPPAPDCAVRMNLTALPNAMIGLALDAPCQPGARVVLGHAGLAFTLVTSAEGTLATSLPALSAEAKVTVQMPGGQDVSASVQIPDAAALRRFAVQWQADDAFQLHAFESGADYGEPGHLSADRPGLALPGVPAAGGFVTVLGDATAGLPLLAQVYTFPKDDATPAEVVVEAAVTPATCGRDLLGETLSTFGGQVTRADLTLAMPDCSALGDILVLKNLLPDTKIAAAN